MRINTINLSISSSLGVEKTLRSKLLCYSLLSLDLLEEINTPPREKQKIRRMLDAFRETLHEAKVKDDIIKAKTNEVESVC